MSRKAKAAIYKKLHFRLLLYVAAVLIFAMPAGAALEHHFLYFPASQHAASPNTIGLPFENITFQASDGIQLNGWLIPGVDSAPVVLFCIGNAGNISHRLETLQLLHELGVAVFIFNYRGYGQSKGRANEAGLYLDVIAALNFLHTRGWEAKRIVIFGRSLGAAVGLEAAIQTSPAGLIMESAFTSVPAMGRYHYPLLNSLLGWLIDAEYNNLEKIPQLKSPLLLIHGDRDNICPPRMAEELFKKAEVDKKLHWIRGADHNNGFFVGGDDYQTLLQQAIKSWTGFGPGQ
jgi:fermentation-respiration switch protein FrsA (DUF1100 family)